MTASPFPPGARIAVYLRDSGGEEQELSVLQQKQELTRWAQEEGLIVSRVFVDAAAPGSSTVGRAQFNAMLTHFKNGAQERGVVVWKFSRFARNIDDAQFYRADLRRRGYIVHSLHDQIPGGADGRLFEAAIDWMNERYLRDLAEDVKRGLRYNVRQHGAVPGTPPRGFMRVPVQIGARRDGSPHIVNRWQPDPALVPRIRQAFEMRARGESYAAIRAATKLFRAKNSYSTFFRNRIYYGELRYADLIIADYCEPIVPRAVWESANRVSRQRATLRERAAEQHPRRVGSHFSLSGLAYCQRCGSPLNGHYTGGGARRSYPYYVCSRRKRRQDCDAGHIPRRALEQAVSDSLTSALTLENLLFIQGETQRVWNARMENSAHDEKRQRAQLVETRAQINNITAAIANSGHSRALLARLGELEREEDKIELTLSQYNAAAPRVYSQPELRELGAEMTRLLNSKNPAERRAAIRSMVARVTVRRDGNRLIGVLLFAPDKLSVVQVVPPEGREPIRLKIPINTLISRKNYSASA